MPVTAPQMDFHNACTEEFIVGSCRYWIDTFGIDGLRLDFTKGYYGGSAEHGLPKVIAGVREHLAAGDAERRDAFPIVIEHLNGVGCDRCRQHRRRHRLLGG